MTVEPLRALANRRLWVYGGGLAAIAGVRLAPVSREVRLGAVGLVLAVMVLTYAGEHVDGDASPGLGLLAVALVGIAGGVALALTGHLAGLAFVAGGLLFLRRALRAGERA